MTVLVFTNTESCLMCCSPSGVFPAPSFGTGTTASFTVATAATNTGKLNRDVIASQFIVGFQSTVSSSPFALVPHKIKSALSANL